MKYSVSQCEFYRLMTDPWLFLHMVFIVSCKESSSNFSDRIQFLELGDSFCAACRKLYCFLFHLHLLWLENTLSVECFLAFWVNASYTVFPRGVLPSARWTAPVLWGDLLMSSPFSTAATFFFFFLCWTLFCNLCWTLFLLPALLLNPTQPVSFELG